MRDSFLPELKGYEDCWPVRSALKLALKYGAEASRRAATKDLNEKLRRAIRNTSLEV
jgi:hypothetical protein